MISIGLVTYNSLPDLPPCLDSVQQQTWTDWRIVCLDNASQDGTRTWLETHHLHPISSPINAGYGRAHNHLIQISRLGDDDYYMPLNPDVILSTSYLAALVDILRETGAGWATGKLVQSNTQLLYSTGHALLWHGYAFNIAFGLPDDERFATPGEVFGAPGAAPLYSAAFVRRMIEQDGYFFDPDFFMYGEDVELDWRARRRGGRCWYTPYAVAFHRGSTPTTEMQIEAVGNRYLTAMRHTDHLPSLLIIMLGHCLLRVGVSPRLGLRLLWRLLRAMPGRIASRRSGQDLGDWFAWSVQQPSAQPRTWSGRLLRFAQHWMMPL